MFKKNSNQQQPNPKQTGLEPTPEDVLAATGAMIPDLLQKGAQAAATEGAQAADQPGPSFRRKSSIYSFSRDVFAIQKC